MRRRRLCKACLAAELGAAYAGERPECGLCGWRAGRVGVVDKSLMEAIERAKGVGPEGKYLDFARRWQRGLERLRMQRKPYVDPRPERVLRFLRFIERERVPPGLSLLSVPSLVPGWIVQRNRDPANLEPRYDVWFPDDRDARVPWAVGLPSVTLTRDSLMEVLRFRWSKDAGEFLMAAEAAKER